MQSKVIEVESYVGTTLKQEYSTQESDTLMVILPGGWYTIFGPILFYSYNIGIELGMDVLTIEYGFQKMNVEYDNSKVDCIVKESKAAIDIALESGNYRNIVFIGKCFGTKIISLIADEYREKYKIVPVFITPDKAAISSIREYGGLVIIGTSDPLYEDFKEVLDWDNIEKRVIEGANHDLDVKLLNETIDHMKQSIFQIKDFVWKHTRGGQII